MSYIQNSVNTSLPYLYNIRKHEIDIYYFSLIINLEGRPYAKTPVTSWLRLPCTLSLTTAMS